MAPTSSSALDAWLQSGKYLPKFLRDFHDQKRVFRAIHETVREDPGGVVKRPNWVECHVYVIDVFLWYMARRGYTLQRSRVDLEYRDLEADVAEREAIRDTALALVLKEGVPGAKLTPDTLA